MESLTWVIILSAIFLCMRRAHAGTVTFASIKENCLHIRTYMQAVY